MKTFEDFETKLMAVYGTLLTGHGNWSWALSDAKLVAKDTITGYSMRTSNYGGYPAIFKNADGSGEIAVEVFDIESLGDEAPTTFRRIDGMEFGAGYIRRLVTTEGGNAVWLYVMPDEYGDRFPVPIESGSWNEFVNQGREVRTA